MQTIGVFGGTFDPPHLGHLVLSEEAHYQFGLDRLLWVLTPDPPHKQGRTITPLKHRLAMVKLAIAENTQFELSTVELTRSAPQYALDTLKILARQNPGSNLIYLMGGDSLRDLPAWHRPSEFLSACYLIGVMHRPGAVFNLPELEKILPGLTSKVRLAEAPLIDISAHDIRLRVAKGRPFRYLLPPEVFAYICDHNLYTKRS